MISPVMSLNSNFVFNNNVQGDQNSHGIIPLAIKDVFSMIQDVRYFARLVVVDYLNYISGILPLLTL